jgi:hypothetical protein
MPILKVELNLSEVREALAQFGKDRKAALEQFGVSIKQAAETTLNQLMRSELSLFLGREDQADNKRNGYETRSYALKGIGSLQIRVPVDRKRRFESSIIPKGERIDPRLKEDMAALALAGISSRTLAIMSKRILGVDVSHETVANTLPLLKDQATAWLERPLNGQWWALLVDGTNFKVTRRGSVVPETALSAGVLFLGALRPEDLILSMFKSVSWMDCLAWRLYSKRSSLARLRLDAGFTQCRMLSRRPLNDSTMPFTPWPRRSCMRRERQKLGQRLAA